MIDVGLGEKVTTTGALYPGICQGLGAIGGRS